MMNSIIQRLRIPRQSSSSIRWTAARGVVTGVVDDSSSSSFRGQRAFSSSRMAAAATAAASAQPQPQVVTVLKLNNLHDNPGAVKKKRRVGRGIGSSKGKTCGRGHKGQKARSGGNIHPTFEGGQTPLYKLFPKRGFNNKEFAMKMEPLSVGTLQTYIDMQRIFPAQDKILNLHDLVKAGLFKPNAIEHGVKLLSDGSERLKQPIDIYISRASTAAIDAIEAAGGTVTTVHYNQLALRQLVRPHKFANKLAIKQARPPPKFQPYYTSWSRRGYLHPRVQMREFLRDKPQLAQEFEKVLQEQEAEQEKEKQKNNRDSW